MRFKITLKKRSGPCNIPINYQPYITAGIYKILEQVDPEYSDFLHNTGYKKNNKRFKYFTFSLFNIPKGKWEMEQGRLLIFAQKITLTVSFLIDKAMENFIIGLFQNQVFEIIDKFAHNTFEVEQIEAEKEAFTEECQTFRAITPVVVKRQQLNHKNYDYLSPKDEGYEDIFIENLISKYSAYVSCTPNASVSQSKTIPKFELLDSFKIKSKLITVKPNLQKPIQVRGYIFDFRLTAPIDLLNIGFLGGFGSNNAQGFGMVRILK